MSSRRAVLLLFVSLVIHSTNGNDNVDSNETTKQKMNNLQLLAGMLDEHGTTRGFESSTFNPDVLNKFLEEYANKIKYTTEESFKLHPYPDTTTQVSPQSGDKTHSYDFSTNDDKHVKPTETYNTQSTDYGQNPSLNDTNQRNKYNNMNSQDDRNGWVALDAIPWSKSKISKWQSSPSTQNPWPDSWDNPNTIKPWNRPKPMSDFPTRPSFNQDGPAYTQKWPPESAPWDNSPYRPNIEIITDNRPSNFPNNWDRNQMPKPNYPWNRFSSHNNNNFQDWNYPPKYEHLEHAGANHPDFNRRPFPQYQYDHNPPSPPQPGNGEGQWILLSTNRGYSKTRQRSIQINASNGNNVTDTTAINTSAPVVSTRRQVRLTVLPSINGVNTTISHGGLLEVENTFKTVDQSQKEYEQSKMLKMPTIIRNKLFKNTMIGKPSKAAVLAAVGAGMLPVTMAMMIPMMLGRRKRSLKDEYDFKSSSY